MDKTHKLQDIESPNLFRDTFPYVEFPKVVFDNDPVPYEMPEEIWITDTTFRDGQQARPPYTPEQVLRIYDFLHEIDGGAGLIRQSEFFLYSVAVFQYFLDRVAELAFQGKNKLESFFRRLDVLGAELHGIHVLADRVGGLLDGHEAFLDKSQRVGEPLVYSRRLRKVS